MASDKEVLDWFRKFDAEAWEELKRDIGRRLTSGAAAVHRWGNVMNVVGALVDYPEYREFADELIASIRPVYDIAHGKEPNDVLNDSPLHPPVDDPRKPTLQQRQSLRTSECCILRAWDLLFNPPASKRSDRRDRT